MAASDDEEIKSGEEQVTATINALYDYRTKIAIALLRGWLERGTVYNSKQ